jgi:hypothetical protein
LLFFAEVLALDLIWECQEPGSLFFSDDWRLLFNIWA